jgi:hypothetical protein
MRHMVKKPGIAWSYQLNNNYGDSLYRSAQTGDKLTIYVCGNELQTETFDIVVEEPTNNANIVIPIDHSIPLQAGGAATNNTQKGILGWPRVTRDGRYPAVFMDNPEFTHESGVDTITGHWHGLPHALRTDSLLKYLEKPANANWEIILRTI